MKLTLACALILLAGCTPMAYAQDPGQPVDVSVPRQPLLAGVHRLIETMEVIGSPLDADTRQRLTQLKSQSDGTRVVREVQRWLDPHCLAIVDLQPNGPPQVTRGPAKAVLLEQGWRTFLVKVINRTGQTGRLLVDSPNARPLPHAPASEVESRWMQMSTYEGQPMRPNLSGLELEYRVVQIFCRDVGTKQGLLEFSLSGSPGEEGSELIHQWRFDDGPNGWRAMNQIELSTKDGSLHVTSTGNDPFMGAEVEGPEGAKVLRFWAQSDVGGFGQVFWWTKDRPQPSGDRRVNFLMEAGREQLYEVPFVTKGQLAGVRIDPLVRTGQVRFDWIDLCTAKRTENWTKLPIEFQSKPGTQVTFRITDQEGLPAFARFVIRDQAGQIYPAQSKRLAPDFFFQPHIYRGDGETIGLPAGEYTVVCSRGPETETVTRALVVGDQPTEFEYRVRRWIDPSARGWWSGDHHIHAAGCLHYENPTQGVQPSDMIRHIMGEDLKVGCCLTWGPCFDYQKRFFTGSVAEQSRYPYTLRYDVEVSGFGSHVSGHLNLLNLKQQIYPGGESKDHWPTLGLNTLRWAKSQGAVCGPAHSSIGLSRAVGRVPGTDGKDGPHGLPNFNVPAFDGIGANEFVVDVTHEVPGPDGKLVCAVDFISAMNTERVAEWNMWYHVLNCGFRVAVSGETDFPCITGERVGIGRVYAHVDGRLDFGKWVRALADGRSYVSDGQCHLLDFAAESASGAVVEVGRDGSELQLPEAGDVTFRVTAAARLDGAPDREVELIVNGYPAAVQTVKADGSLHDLKFELNLKESSWVALRMFPNAHTNPIYVVVDGRPVRGTVDSARWCLAGVKQCWISKQNTYAEEEQNDAREAYDHAQKVYGEIVDSGQ